MLAMALISVLSRVVGGLKSCVWYGLRRLPPKLKVAGYFHHSRCCHWWPPPCLANPPAHTAAPTPTPASHQIVGSMVPPAALPPFFAAVDRQRQRRADSRVKTSASSRSARIGMDVRTDDSFEDDRVSPVVRRRKRTRSRRPLDKDRIALQAGRCLRPGRRRARNLVLNSVSGHQMNVQ